MKTLPLNKRKNGYDYTLIVRGLKSCIYEQRLSENKKHYEVFRIRIQPEKFFQNKILEAKECFPHDEAFGNWAWSCFTYEEALSKWNLIENNELQ